MAKEKANADKATPTRAVTKDRPKTAKALANPGSGIVYQLKITLNKIKPPIWRRVQTRDCTLAKLHDIIQISMGWEDYHLHTFTVGGERYGDPRQWPKEFEDDLDTLDERKVKLSQITGQGVKKFSYEYDMGDSWEHTITLEKTVPAEAGVKYPRCIDGERACPPEDCGGGWGYPEFVEAIQNPRHKRHEELLEWFGGDFDPEEFDLKAANEKLKGVG